MRGVTAIVRILLILLVIGVIANCADGPTAPERSVANQPTIAFATAGDGNGLSITTDKDDYAPGDTVWFTGAGWTPADSVDIVLTDDPTLDSHQWTVGISADGTFRDSTYVVDTGDLGVTFTLTATSRTNPLQTLTVTFTDGNIRVDGTPSGATFSVLREDFGTAQVSNTTCSGNPTGNLPIPITAGANGPNGLNIGGITGNQSFRLTAAVTSGSGGAFLGWNPSSGSPGSGTPYTEIGSAVPPATTSRTICVPGFQSGNSGVYTANYTAVPDLRIVKTAPSGSFTVGTNVTYTLAVTNIGQISTSGLVTVQDALPASLSFVSAAGTGWTCSGTSTVSCTRNDALAAGAAYPDISITVTPTGAAIPSVTNTGTINGGGDVSAGNNSSSVTKTVVGVANSPPAAVDDAYSTNEDTPLSVNAADGVLKNDTDPDGNALTTVLVSGPDPAKTLSFSLAANGSFNFTPAADFFGSVTFTYKAFDGLVNSNTAATVTITVNPINDPPSFTKGADQTVLEDAGAQTVSGWATGISAGPPNESGQTVSFQVTGNTNSGLFLVDPAVSSTGTLTYTPAADANGSATITLVLKDDGGTADGGDDTSDPQTFKITVTAVNDVPSFTKGADQTANEGSGGQNVSGWATAISAGPADESGQTLTFEVTGNTVPGIFSVGPAIASNGTLTYTPSLGQNGTSTITVRLKDNGGTANGGVDTSPTQTFDITVNNVLPTLGSITAPNDPLQVGTLVTASATFSDPGTDDPHTTRIDWGDGAVTDYSVASGSTTASGTHIYSLPGVYTLTMKVQDDVGYSNEVIFQYVVIFDPSAGFVTGGGWINSPLGAYTPNDASDPDIVGKATFGFVSKYQKGAIVPNGNTEFQFHAASLNFKSTAYEWLVVQGNSRASYKGSGTVNGGGNYGFLLSVVDGGNVGDKFRIKIWDKGTGTVLYDNQSSSADDAAASQLIGDGSIVVHSK